MVKVRVLPSKLTVPLLAFSSPLAMVAEVAEATLVTLPWSNNLPGTASSELRVSVLPVICRPAPPVLSWSTPPKAPPATVFTPPVMTMCSSAAEPPLLIVLTPPDQVMVAPVPIR